MLRLPVPQGYTPLERDGAQTPPTLGDEHASVLSSVTDDAQPLAGGGKGAATEALGPPLAPADRRLRETDAATSQLRQSAWFTPDAQAVAFPDHKELAVWDLNTSERTVAVRRTGGIIASALSPDGQWLCVAAEDGLAVYSWIQGSCELKWEAHLGTHFCDVAFGGDGSMIASMRGGDTGLVEVRDVETSKPPKVIGDFPASGLSFSRELLAVGGKKGEPSGKQVRLYSVASNFEAVVMLELPGTKEGRSAWALAFNPAGDRLAVVVDQEGYTAAPFVVVFSGENGWQDPPLLLGAAVAGDINVSSVCFSNDGRFLCAGYFPSGTFAIWDLDAATCVRVIKRPGTFGQACAFSPADDLLLTGGHTEVCVIHELLPKGPVTTLSMPGGEDDTPLAAACASAEVAVLARGTCVAAVRVADGKELWHQDMQAEVGAGAQVGAVLFPLALQPTGGQVAVCMTRIKVVSLWDVQTGKEIKQLSGGFDGGWFPGANYSSDGSLVFVFGSWGTKVYTAATVELLHSLKDKGGGSVMNCISDPSGKFLVTTGNPGTAFVKDRENGENVHALDDSMETAGVSFDNAGDRMAYWLCGKLASGGQDHECNGHLIICDARDGGFRELKRFTVPSLGHAPQLQFSPSDGRYLLAAGWVRNGKVLILDAETGEQPAWSECFRALAMPAGQLHFGSVRWVLPQTETDESGGVSSPQPLILQATVGSELHFIDVSAFIRSFEEDGNFSVEQLNRLSDTSPDAIPALLKNWPRLVNLRDPTTGDTALHHCARGGSSMDPKTVAVPAMHWLSTSGLPYELLTNAKGKTALHEAISRRHMRSSIYQMLSSLNPKLPLNKTDVLTENLRTCAQSLPGQLVKCIQLLQDSEHYGLFRQIRKVNYQKVPLEHFDVRGSSAKDTTQFDKAALIDLAPDRWAKYEWRSSTRPLGDGLNLGRTRTSELARTVAIRIDTKHEVLALRGFVRAPVRTAGRHEDPAYTHFFRAGQRLEDAVSSAAFHDLLNTKLMVIATQFKWETFGRRRVLQTMVLYLIHLLVAAVTLLLSTQLCTETREFHQRGGWSSDWSKVNAAMWCDILQLVLLLTNSMMLCKEWREMFESDATQELATRWLPDTGSEELKKYFTDPWNNIDLAGILALYVAILAHFLDADFVLMQVGGLGVLLNAWSVLQLLRPFSSTGPMIKVMTASTRDVLGFMLVMSVMIWGYSVAFAVSMPKNKAFLPQNATMSEIVASIGRPWLTTTMAMVGDFDVDEYEHVALVMFLSFLFFVIIVNFNVLIAIVSERFNVVMETAEVEVRKLRAELMINDEARMSDAERSNAEWFPEYLEVLQVDSADPQTGFRQHEDTLSSRLENVAAEEARLATEAKVDATSEKQDLLAADVGQVAADVAQLKALMTQLVEQTKPPE